VTTPETGAIKMSQGLDVLQPRSGEAYPIPCEEWEFLKSKIRLMSDSPWFYQTVGSALVGAAISTALALLFATLSERQQIIAWAAVAATAVCGALALLFAHQQKKVRQVQASDVLVQMEIIEKRYERGGNLTH
jgi:hypothetical protein